MIVKDESAIIEKCLNSVKDHIDCYVICDTGSTDDTKEKIKSVMDSSNIPGEIHDIEFRNFEYARNKALDLAKTSELDFDYLLLDDADMELEVLDPDWRSKLEGDYLIIKQYNAMAYYNVRLIKRGTDCEYKGVTHEYLDCQGERVQFDLIQYIDHACGSSRKEKYSRDAKLLEEGIKNEKEEGLITRYYFYLAQTYADMGTPESMAKAITNYRKRILRKGWSEEIYYSYYRIGLAIKSTNCLQLGTEGDMLKAFIDAYNVNPARIEPLQELAHWYRHKENYYSGYMFAKMACSAPYPEGNMLFVANPIYDWKRFDELAICAYWIGSYKESFDLCSYLLNLTSLPENQRERIENNKRFSADKLKNQ